MYVQFLIEDISGEKLIDAVMQKYKAMHQNIPIEYKTLSYKGIGGFIKGQDARDVKARQLLNDLPKRLRAFNATLRYKENASLFIVLDNDQRDTSLFRSQLYEMVSRERILIDHVFCIAIEEMEAWLLGDCEAIKAAYPEISDRILTKHANYQQDSICGTWELLADMLTKKGLAHFRKQNPTAFDIGRCKSEWAEKIGRYLALNRNASPSFQYMIRALDSRLEKVNVNG